MLFSFFIQLCSQFLLGSLFKITGCDCYLHLLLFWYIIRTTGCCDRYLDVVLLLRENQIFTKASLNFGKYSLFLSTRVTTWYTTTGLATVSTVRDLFRLRPLALCAAPKGRQIHMQYNSYFHKSIIQLWTV